MLAHKHLRNFNLKKLFEFKCSKCDEVFEELTEYKQESSCPLCDSKADKIISSPRINLEGYSRSFPSASDAWVKRHKLSVQRD